MENELAEKIKEQDAKLDAIWRSVEKTRKYFLVIIWITVIAFVLPFVGLIFAAPYFLNSYISSFQGLI